MAFQSQTTSFALKNDIFLINQVVYFLSTPNLIFYIAFLILWGIAFKKIETIRSWIVGVMFLFVASLCVFVELFAFIEFAKTTGAILIVKLIATSVAFVTGGTIVLQVANEQRLESY